jgi:hypothetical protein
MVVKAGRYFCSKVVDIEVKTCDVCDMAVWVMDNVVVGEW